MSGERAKALGRRLHVARDEKGWKKSDTARRLGIKLPTYLRYEDGDRTPSVELLLRASEIYDRPVGWFFAEAEAVQIAEAESAIHPDLRRILNETPWLRQQAVAEVMPVVNLVCDRMANNQSNAN
jgi:transcriptional regulator with XRE-family HTH domain